MRERRKRRRLRLPADPPAFIPIKEAADAFRDCRSADGPELPPERKNEHE